MDQQVSIDWSKVTYQDLKKAADDPRSKLPSLFERAWLKTMGEVIPCINCEGFENKLNLFQQKLIEMAENKCDYRLKGKYNGVWGYSNAELTNKKAEKLAKEHGRGLDLFDTLPKELAQERAKKIKEKEKAIQKIREDKKAKEQALRKKNAEDQAKIAGESKKKTMIDKQNEAEAIAKQLQQEEKDRKERRMNELNSKDRSWLIKKAKSLSVTATGTTEEIAKRIFNKE